ncbi:Uu.00g053260.m01.CDS01 [Anthostomella pinea]|uniref:Uu.00g053260.m01.CDS01 n=1 Tax=Anthostomella pinea TaxID=933095 RepID=A0AAI8VQP6_9PEZI|nr:Uu.00g053260.m01.CDS01 [Anthostomella pinea]
MHHWGMTRPVFKSVLLLAAAVSGDVTFVRPGPGVPNSTDTTTSNAVHPLGTYFHIAWSGTNQSRLVSVVLFQTDGLDLEYPFEYVVQTLTGETSFDWTVRTGQNLSFSNLFLLSLFYDGENRPAAFSETFNITDVSPVLSASTSSTSSTSSTGSTGSTSFASSTSSTSSISAASAATPKASSTATSDDSSASGLPVGVKAGISVAVLVVALLGIAAGELFFRHRANKQQHPATLPAPAPFPREQKPEDPIQKHYLYEMANSYEMDAHYGGQRMPHELDSGAQHSLVPQELYGDSARQ